MLTYAMLKFFSSFEPGYAYNISFFFWQTYHYQTGDFPSKLVIRGVQNSTTYNISMRAESVSGIKGQLGRTSYNVPVPGQSVFKLKNFEGWDSARIDFESVGAK